MFGRRESLAFKANLTAVKVTEHVSSSFEAYDVIALNRKSFRACALQRSMTFAVADVAEVALPLFLQFKLVTLLQFLQRNGGHLIIMYKTLRGTENCNSSYLNK